MNIEIKDYDITIQNTKGEEIVGFSGFGPQSYERSLERAMRFKTEDTKVVLILG